MMGKAEGPITPPAPELKVQNGCCHVLFAYDVGLWIDLDDCDRRINLNKHRHTIQRQRRAPRYSDYQPAPLRVTQQHAPRQILDHATSEYIDMVLYDFGAIGVQYHIPLNAPFQTLLHLSDELYDHEELLADSLRCVEQLMSIIQPAVSKPVISEAVEDYVIFEIKALQPRLPLQRLCTDYATQIAQILRADAQALSEQEVADALQCRISFGPDDLAIIDWNAAMLFDQQPEDVCSVLDFANVELLELRCLDEQLDHALESAYETLVKPKPRLRLPGAGGPELQRVAMLQVDSAMLFEGINNALKLLGDHYLARVYHLAAQRFHLKEWDDNILRKINTLESIYEKISNQASNLRLEVLEWIIIVLIAISIILSLVLE